MKIQKEKSIKALWVAWESTFAVLWEQEFAKYQYG